MPRGRATMLLAKAQRLDGSPAKSIKTLEKLIETKDPLHYVEMAEAYLALLKPEIHCVPPPRMARKTVPMCLHTHTG